MKTTLENIERTRKSGEELFQYGKDIMGLESWELIGGLGCAIGHVLEKASDPEDLGKLLYCISSIIICEVVQLRAK